MANDIRQKIILEGEKEYKSAIKEAQRNLKLLNSEIKAETAELGKNATEQQKAEAKAKNLKQQIAEQEKVVKTYTDALEEVRTKYADNEDEIAKWEIKLNDARAALANMQNDLEGVGDAFSDVQRQSDQGVVATKSFADAFGNLGDIGDSISSKIEDVFSGMLSTIRSAAVEIWDLITETASRANSWTDMADLYGTSTTEIQKMQSAMAANGKEFSTFTQMINRLKYGGVDDTIAQYFMIKRTDENDLEWAVKVMDQLAVAKKGFEKSGKWDEVIGKIFGGKKGDAVMDLANAWEDISEKATEFENKGYIMGEKEVATMNAVSLELLNIEEKWNKLKDRFAEGFGQTSLTIMTNAEGVLDSLAEYFNAKTPEERDAALKTLEENVKATFESIAQAIRDGIEVLKGVSDELKASEDPLVQGLGNVLGGIVSALEWFTVDNGNNFKEALMIIAGAWTAGKVLSMVGTIGKLAGSIATISAAKGMNGILAALNGGGAAGAGGAASGAASAAGGAGLLGKLSWFFSGAALPVIVAAAGVLPAVIAQSKDEKTAEEKREERLAAAEEMEEGPDKQFLTQAANALGLKRDENGELEKNIFGQNWLGGSEQEIYSLLMGLKDKSGIEKSKLLSMLNGSVNQWNGNYARNDLMRLWEGAEMDDGTLRGLLEVITDAYANKQPEWWQTVSGEINRPHYGLEDQTAGIQAWWDAHRDALNETGTAEDEEAAYMGLVRMFGGTGASKLMDRLFSWIEKEDDPYSMEDIPSDWWTKTPDENGVTSQDIQGLNDIPNRMENAVIKGLSNFKVELDGEQLVKLLTPGVSSEIAKDIE